MPPFFSGPSVPAILALADGTIFKGISIGAAGHTTGEVVFNTAMTGYQEILTDPSYCTSDRHADVPARRQLRHQRRRRRSVQSPRGRPDHPRPAAAGLEFPLHPVAVRLPEGGEHRRHRRHRYPQADPPAAREGRPERRHPDRQPGQRAVRPPRRWNWRVRSPAWPAWTWPRWSRPPSRLRVDRIRMGAGRGLRQAGRAEIPRGRLRLRRQAQHPAHAGRARLQGHRAAGASRPPPTRWR